MRSLIVILVLMEMFNDYKKEGENKEVNEEGGVDDNICSSDLLKYAELYEKGLLTLDEFEVLKKRILS